MSNELGIELTSKLHELGYELDISYDINDEHEEIAFAKNQNRYIEILRVKDEKEMWVSANEHKINLGVLNTKKIELVINILKDFIIELISPENLFDNCYEFEYPKGIKKGLIGKELLYELSWKEVMNNYKSNEKNYFEMIQVCEILKEEKTTKKLIPFLSLNRLCFSRNYELTDSILPCIYKPENESQNSNIIVSEFSGKIIEKGNVKNVIDKFLKSIKTLPNNQ